MTCKFTGVNIWKEEDLWAKEANKRILALDAVYPQLRRVSAASPGAKCRGYPAKSV